MEHEKTLSQRYTIVLAAATVSSENAREPFLLLLFLRCPWFNNTNKYSLLWNLLLWENVFLHKKSGKDTMEHYGGGWRQYWEITALTISRPLTKEGSKNSDFFLKKTKNLFHPLLYLLSVFLWTTLKPERWINCMDKDLVIFIAQK